MLRKKLLAIFSLLLFAGTNLLHPSQLNFSAHQPALAEAPANQLFYHQVKVKKSKNRAACSNFYAKAYSLWKHHPILCLCGLTSFLGGALSCFLLDLPPTTTLTLAPHSLSERLQEEAKNLVALNAEMKLEKNAELEHALSLKEKLTTLRRRNTRGATTQHNQPQLSARRKAPTVQLVATAAIVQENYEKRKKQYTQSLDLLNEIRKKTNKNLYILESCKKSSTFLDEHCPTDGCAVFYTQTNDPKLSNYGINLAKSLLSGLKHLAFSPDDTIIIFNARYTPKDNQFIEFVDKNPTADVIVKIWNERDAYTALFAIKSKYLLDFLENHIDPIAMEKEKIPFEYCFGEFITKIRQKGANVIDLDIPTLYDLPVVAKRDYVNRFFQPDR